MNIATIKILLLSLVLLASSGGAAFYLFTLQEKNGELIKNSLLEIKTWEELRYVDRASNTDLSGDEADLLRSLVLHSESDTVKFLAFMDDAAETLRVEMVATGLKVERTKESGFDDLSASFLIRGDIGAVEGMLQLFEAMPYRSSVVSVSYIRNTNGTAEANVSLFLSVKK
jgi:hypothetical protein